MIPRYSRPEMASIWSPETKFRIWFEIEAHALDAMAELGEAPREAASKVWERGGKARFDVARIDAIERDVKHDVIAFLTHLAEIVGPEAHFIHQGMTSSNVLDTYFNVQLVRAADLLIAHVYARLASIKNRAINHYYTPTISRSHMLMPSSTGPAAAWNAPGWRSRPAPFPARSAAPRMSIRASKSTWPAPWG